MNRKYPMSMFLFGVINNLITKWYIILLAIVVLLLRIPLPGIPVFVPFIILGILLIYAVIEQTWYRKAVLNLHGESVDEFLDQAFADNGKGFRNIINAVDVKIHNHLNCKVEVVGVYAIPETPEVKLVEVVIERPPSQVDAGMFTQTDSEQVSYGEHYLNEDGTAVIDRFCDIPENIANTRIAFFLNNLNADKPLSSQFGDVVLPAESPMPDRLKTIIKSVPVD